MALTAVQYRFSFSSYVGFFWYVNNKAVMTWITIISISTNPKVGHIFISNQQNHLKLCMKIDNETEEHRSSFVIICFLFGAKHFQVGTG